MYPSNHPHQQQQQYNYTYPTTATTYPSPGFSASLASSSSSSPVVYQNVELDEFGLHDDQTALDARLVRNRRTGAEPSTPRELRPTETKTDESISDVITLRENLDRIDKAMVKQYSVGSVSAQPASDEYWEMLYYVSKQHGPMVPDQIAAFLKRATQIRNIAVFHDSMAQTIKVRVHCKDLVVYRHRWSDLVFNYVTVLMVVFVIGAFLL